MQYILGKRIEEELERTGMSKAEFGRRIGTSRQNVNAILQRRDLTTDLVLRISKVLRFNFFHELALRASTNPDYGKEKIAGRAYYLLTLYCSPSVNVVDIRQMLEMMLEREASLSGFRLMGLGKLYVEVL